MNRNLYIRSMLLTAVIFSLLLAVACGEQAKPQAQATKKEYAFRGKVEKIDLNAKTFTVNNEKVAGWMEAMSMVYVPDKEDVLKRVKIGDQITAKVYDGDYRTLYNVQVVPPKPEAGKAPAKK